MVRAGIRAAGELAALAIEETGFGVFEDKVVKNYTATEFLSDYLRDKRSVGVIEEDVEHDIVRVAEPIGVVLGDHAGHQPDVDGALQGDRRRQDPQRDRLPAVAVRRPLLPSGASRSSARPPRPPGCRPARSR